MIAYLINRRKIERYGILLVFLSMILLMALVGATEYQGDTFRLHIIANSDSRADQGVKLLVRDRILDWISQDTSAKSYGDNMEGYFASKAGDIEAVAEGVLQSQGFAYGAKALVGPAEYPWREWEGQAYPAGNYESLRVVLGQGNGQNWWCVLFPPLSLVDMEQAEAEEVEYKSFFAELFQNLFGGQETGQQDS